MRSGRQNNKHKTPRDDSGKDRVGGGGMSDEDGLIGALIGGILGAALASPKPEDKKALEEYRAFQSQINSKVQRVPVSQDLINKLGRRPEYYNSFIESYRAYSYGLFRSSNVVASALIESMLRERFEGGIAGVFAQAFARRERKEVKKKNFFGLIEEAKKEKIIEDSDYYFLHGLRSQRNDSAHDVLKEVSELDSATILNIAIKIIGKLI